MIVKSDDEPLLGWRIPVTKTDDDVAGRPVSYLWASMYEGSLEAETKVREKVGSTLKTAEIVNSLDPTLVKLLGLTPGDVVPL